MCMEIYRMRWGMGWVKMWVGTSRRGAEMGVCAHILVIRWCLHAVHLVATGELRGGASLTGLCGK